MFSSVLQMLQTNNNVSELKEQEGQERKSTLADSSATSYGRSNFSVKEVAETIPKFDPINDSSISDEQFVGRVESTNEEGNISITKYRRRTKALSGYYRILIKESSRKYTVFITTEGLYEFKHMPFGLKMSWHSFKVSSSKLKTVCNQRRDQLYELLIAGTSYYGGLDHFVFGVGVALGCERGREGRRLDDTERTNGQIDGRTLSGLGGAAKLESARHHGCVSEMRKEGGDDST
ncbi:unnamed protein product [Ceratitis capitata]|uniref:(Mediterranean fruit fly) hypothetical protein n=1 Tax=Ceratitis capitata TaxID=7213 RepID=A0A811URI4_CERCA|nr:unnamed protein product [Ceratitis capitata]